MFGLLRARLLYHVPAAVFPVEIKDLWMGRFSAIQKCGYFVNQFAKPFALNTVFFLENGQCVSQDIILANILFCQSIALPKYHFAKVLFCQKFLQHFLEQMPALIDLMSIPLQHLRMILRGFHQVTSQGRWSHWNHHPL